MVTDTQGAAAMPTAQLVYDDRSTYPSEQAELDAERLFAEFAHQVMVMLRVELAKLAPQDRRLFCYEVQEPQTRVEVDTIAGTQTLVLEADPPRTWLVQRGSDADNLTAEQVAQLVKAGASACRFGGSDREACDVALCDYCHPEAWA